MSLGKLSCNVSKKRKVKSQADLIDDEIKALVEKKQKYFKEEKPEKKACRLAGIEFTPEVDEILGCLTYWEHFHMPPILPVEISLIIVQYQEDFNANETPLVFMFKDIFPKNVSQNIASFTVCGWNSDLKDPDLKYPDGKSKDIIVCTEMPIYFCPRARKSVCRKHLKVPTKYFCKGNLHVKEMCNLCWVTCPCKSVWTDLPLAGIFLDRIIPRCAQCLVRMCTSCSENNRCRTYCPHVVAESTEHRPLCINCMRRSESVCKKCLGDRAINSDAADSSPDED